MTDRENSPAYQMLPRSARRVFGAIERAIGAAAPAGSPHRTEGGVAIVEAARSFRADRDRAGSAPRSEGGAFRPVDAEASISEHEIARNAFSQNRERLKAERFAREEAAAPPTKAKRKRK
jgi:hypothetical protein